MNTGTDEFFVLLVEDNLADVETVLRSAEKLSFEVQVEPIRNGREALEYFRSVRGSPSQKPLPDLVLLDLNLPGMTGQKLLEDLRGGSSWENTPVVVFSGSSEKQEIYQSYERGANAYVSKPGSPGETARVLEDMFSFYRDVDPSRT